MEKSNTPFVYVIEHFETELSEWTLKEYVHMLMLLSGLYSDKQVNSMLVITNFKFIHLFKKGELKDDCLNTLKHTETFIRIKESFGDKAVVSGLSF